MFIEFIMKDRQSLMQCDIKDKKTGIQSVENELLEEKKSLYGRKTNGESNESVYKNKLYLVKVKEYDEVIEKVWSHRKNGRK